MKAQRGNTGLGILIGLGLGLIIAGIVAFLVLKGGSGFRKPETQTPLTPIPTVVNTPPTQVVAPQPDTPTTAAISATTPAPTSAPAPTLPNAAPAIAPSPPVSAAAPNSPATTDAGNFFLQIGAYANKEEAENQRARLALLGQEAKLTTVEREGKTLHRLRLGPFAKADEASQARADLAKNGLEAVVVKN